MKEVLITGGAGFIGSHLQDRLLEEGHAVTIVDNLSSGTRKNIRNESRFYEIDVRDKDRLSQVVKDVRPQVIFHLAAQTKVLYSIESPQVDHEINVNGMLNVLDSARDVDSVEKLIYSNTAAVYGDVDSQNLPIKEDEQRLNPRSFYGLSKLTAERYLSLYGNEFNVSWLSLRYSNVYGPRQSNYGEAGIISAFIDRLLSGRTPVINGNGFHTRDYVFVGDVVNANLVAMSYQGSDYFNISSNTETSNIELYRLITSILRVYIPPIFGPERQGDIQRSVLSNQEAKDIFGWIPETELREGIETTISHSK